MKKLLFLYTLLFSLVSFSQEIKFKEYSYSQFMELMTSEKDSVFKLENAIIKYDSITDKEFLTLRFYEALKVRKEVNPKMVVIKKPVWLDNIQFIIYEDFSNDLLSTLHNIIFEQDVTIQNSFGISIKNCVFKKRFEFVNFEYHKYKAAKEKYPSITDRAYVFQSEFLGSIRIINSSTIPENKKEFTFFFGANHIRETKERIFIANWMLNAINFSYNTFDSPNFYYIQIEETRNSIIENNNFNKGTPQFLCIEQDELIFKDNVFNVPSFISFKATNNVNFIGTNQFKSTISSLDGYRDYAMKLGKENSEMSYWEINDNKYTSNNYNTKERIENPTYYQYELNQLSVFYNHFKNTHNTAEANKFYIKIKDLESRRLEYEHNLNPTFTTFFKIQINKFLKLFSNYGTEPERAVIVSLYVILFFALIYLLFPNSWDKHGKNRIMDRYRFFTKYMNREAGIHEVYLEEQKEELLESEEFKTYMLSSEKTIPSFFLKTAMPLYKWSISGMKFSASLLKRVDVMKGTWQNVPEKRRTWKAILLISAFSIALLYDITIKILNALMLSINTFTTLGFGEIPIKGLPRYLAIIQGFIGWFMLTIFSVSLISQLLN